MIASAVLFLIAGTLYAAASYQREQRVPMPGDVFGHRSLRATISASAIVVSVAATVAALLYMVEHLKG